jgi:hypothetical protein
VGGGRRDVRGTFSEGRGSEGEFRDARKKGSNDYVYTIGSNASMIMVRGQVLQTLLPIGKCFSKCYTVQDFMETTLHLSHTYSDSMYSVKGTLRTMNCLQVETIQHRRDLTSLNCLS